MTPTKLTRILAGSLSALGFMVMIGFVGAMQYPLLQRALISGGGGLVVFQLGAMGAGVIGGRNNAD